jgi:WD40 repeat protein
MAWSPDGSVLAAGMDEAVRLWTSDGKLAATFATPTPANSSKVQASKIAWSPSGKILAAGYNDRTIRLWSSNGKVLAVLGADLAHPESLAWSPDGQLLAAGYDDGTVRLWSPEGQLMAEVAGEGEVIRLTWAAGGQVLASASITSEGLVRLQNRAGTPIESLTGNAPAWSPNGQVIATAELNGAIDLWDASGKFLGLLLGHTDPIYDLAWSPDGRMLASASVDTTVRLWRLPISLGERPSPVPPRDPLREAIIARGFSVTRRRCGAGRYVRT